MTSERLIEAIDSIVRAQRTFYVGDAVQVGDDTVAIEGVTARVVGQSSGADVILKDSSNGEWFAFVRNLDQQPISERNVALYKSDPRPKGRGEFFFISTEGLQAQILTNVLSQFVGTFVIGEFPPYYAEIAPWLVSLPASFTEELNYLDYSKQQGFQFDLGNVFFVPNENTGRLDISSSPYGLPSAAKIKVQIQRGKAGSGEDPPETPPEMVFFKIVFEPQIPASGIRRQIERWSMGLSKDKTGVFGGDYGSAKMRKSLILGFKNQISKNHEDACSNYFHNYQTTGSWVAFLDFNGVSGACTESGAVVNLASEYPVEEIDINITETESARRLRTGGGSDTFRDGNIFDGGLFGAPDVNYRITYHLGDGDFAENENIQELLIPKINNGAWRKGIQFSLPERQILARRIKLFIEIEGARHYAEHVRIDGSDNYRLGFFKDLNTVESTELIFYCPVGSEEPRNVDLSSATGFLLAETLAFANDGILQSFPFQTGTFPASGFVDSNFPEEGGQGGCTFFREEEIEETYDLEVSISSEILPNSLWAYEEGLIVVDENSQSFLDINSPFPRLGLESDIRVRIEDARLNGGIPAQEFNFWTMTQMAGFQGKALPDRLYTGSHYSMAIMRNWTFQSIIVDPDYDEHPNYWEFDYYPGKAKVDIKQNYVDLIARSGALYIEVGGVRYYSDLVSAFGQEIVEFRASLTTPSDASFVDPTGDYVIGTNRPDQDIFSPTFNKVPVADPYTDRAISYNGFQFLNLNTSGKGNFETSGYARNNFPGGSTTTWISPTPLDQTSSGGPNYNQLVTIGLEIFQPDGLLFWLYSEEVVIDGVTYPSPWAVAFEGVNDSNLSLVQWHGGYNVTLLPPSELDNEVDERKIVALPCEGTEQNKNQNELGDAGIFHGFYHLLPSESEVLSLAPSNLSFSDQALTIYGDGRLLFQDIEIWPLHAALDTSDFSSLSDLESAGYIFYTEGAIKERTSGLTFPCLRLRWNRAYPFKSTNTDYYDELSDGRFAEFEAILVDLPDRIDIVFRYIYIGFPGNDFNPNPAFVEWTTADYDTGVNLNDNITQEGSNLFGVPATGTGTGEGIFYGSGDRELIAELPLRKASSTRDGDFVFYIKDGQVRGYNEVFLAENRDIENPIRRSILPYEDFLRQQTLFIRFETTASGAERKKVTFFLAEGEVEEIPAGEPIPPIISAEVEVEDFYQRPPLENKNNLF